MSAQEPDIDLVSSVPDDTLVKSIIESADQRILSWHDLLEISEKYGVSVSRLKKILLILLSSRELVEIKCRLFTTRSFMMKTPPTALIYEIYNTLMKTGIKKCGKPLGNPVSEISVTFTRSGAVMIQVDRVAKVFKMRERTV